MKSPFVRWGPAHAVARQTEVSPCAEASLRSPPHATLRAALRATVCAAAAAHALWRRPFHKLPLIILIRMDRGWTNLHFCCGCELLMCILAFGHMVERNKHLNLRRNCMPIQIAEQEALWDQECLSTNKKLFQKFSDMRTHMTIISLMGWKKLVCSISQNKTCRCIYIIIYIYNYMYTHTYAYHIYVYINTRVYIYIRTHIQLSTWSCFKNDVCSDVNVLALLYMTICYL